jgi:hypothetical protein
VRLEWRAAARAARLREELPVAAPGLAARSVAKAVLAVRLETRPVRAAHRAGKAGSQEVA